MPRGGKRKGAGRKATWNAGKTKPVKLPELLIPEIIEFARTLDQAPIDLELDEALDLLFDELVDRKILDRAAEKMIALRSSQTAQLMSQTSEITTAFGSVNTSIEEGDTSVRGNLAFSLCQSSKHHRTNQDRYALDRFIDLRSIGSFREDEAICSNTQTKIL